MNLKKFAISTCLTLGMTFGAFQPANSYYLPNQPDKGKGYYIYAGLGAGSVSESNVKVKSLGLSGNESFDFGAIMTSGAGYRFPNSGFRAELEYAHRSNDINTLPGFITSTGDGEASYTSNSVMANLLYEFKENNKISPYVGFGLGYTFLKNGGDAEQQYAYQGIAGTFIKIMDDIDLGIAYKYFSTFGTPEMSLKFSPPPPRITEYPYTAHSIEIRGILNF